MDNKKDFKEWFKDQQKRLAIEVDEIPLSEAKTWKILENDGKQSYVGHPSGKYHRGIILNTTEAFREGTTERFLLAPIPLIGGKPYYGVVLMARFKDKYLVQAKSEPGNWGEGHVQITSTIHASYTNIADNPDTINFVWMYNEPNCVKLVVAQDGAQLYLKNNEVCFLELSEEPKDIPSNFTWATKEEIYSFAETGLISEHVMQCLGASVLNS